MNAAGIGGAAGATGMGLIGAGIGGIETVGSQEAKAKLLQMIGQGNSSQEEKIPKDDDPTEVSISHSGGTPLIEFGF